MKAVIPVAGFGTRMLPATKAIPKEMLTVADKPLIQYIVEECIAAGIKDIILVNHSFKTAIVNHFNTAFELESLLKNTGKLDLLAEVRKVCPPGVNLIQVYQDQANGLGQAILCTRPVIGNEPFAVLLPDVLINEYACHLATDNLAKMLQCFQQTHRSQIMVERVPCNEVSKYGIADCGAQKVEAGYNMPMYNIVEKPSIHEAPSDLAVVGRYVLSANIWPLLAKTTPGVGGEIQLTDAIAALIKHEAVDAFVINGYSHDCGNKLGYMKTFIEYSLRHEDYGAELKRWLQQAMK
jgi:UTP--glucose-1-phosphate uridylyltransferase